MNGFPSVWLVFFLPLAGFLVQALLGGTVVRLSGPRFGRSVMGALAVLPVAASFVVAVDITVQLAARPVADRAAVETLFPWIELFGLSVPFEFRVDPLSMTMTLIVTGIGALIHLYATGYMAEDRDFTRFFTYLNLFIAAMLVLVLGNNLALTFVGWEGVGLCSYLLIGFWYRDLANSKAANKAFIVNRIGDWGFTLGLFGVATLVAANREALGVTDPRWLSFDVILPKASELLALYPGAATAIALLLFIGAMGKSAQYPLAVWLPDAMAGPTPVSALIHAATMVTSGVYLLNRMSDWILASPVAMAVVAGVGALTALVGAATAFGQTDIKKVLAYSTVSQLGYMFIACGVGAFYAGLFHVVTHAFFKALLFLGAGAVIHAMAHDQDMRNYGSLARRLPVTFLTMGIAWAAIAGVPYLFSGFWSKEAILGSAVNLEKAVMLGPLTVGQWAGWIGFLVAFMTAAYMTRMMALTFGTNEERWRSIAPDHSEPHEAHPSVGRYDHGPDPHGFFMTDEEAEALAAQRSEPRHHVLDRDHEPHEAPPVMWLPLAVLAVFSLGWFGAWLYEGGVLKTWLTGLPYETKHGPVPHEALIGLSFLTSLGGIALGLWKYWRKLPESEGWDLAKWSPLRLAAARQFAIDDALTGGSIKAGGVLGAVAWAFDRYVVDGLVHLVAMIAGGLGHALKWSQSGYVRGYALLMQAGVVVLIGYLIYAVSTAGGAR
jgi:NADH-quinone oxidoreductase subunit L